MAICSF
ncbi:hypothetical protein CP8484711_0749A, partial [Chlamydia psittaci 84-8471/1]